MFGIEETRRLKHNHQNTYLLMMLFVYFAYLLGIIQDIYYGVTYLAALINGRMLGSFPFMTGWGIIMIWALIRPIERRGVLLITSILVCFMLIEEILISVSAGAFQFPVIRVFGILIWLMSFLFCVRIEKTTNT